MKKFLLLRSNKQTGPYSAEDLQQMGLKPYDLIWVDGKSAAWRYPSEIEELKAFAPVVEEQPYDRFYKKPELEQKAQEAPVETPVAKPNPVTAQPNPVTVKKEKEYKRVFVTLPSGAAAVSSQQASFQPAARKPLQEPVKTPQEPAKPIYTEPEPAVEPAFAATTKPSEIYYPAKRKNKLKPALLVALIIGMIAMVALGVVIGLSINNQGVSMVKNTDPVNNTDDPTNKQAASITLPEKTNEPINEPEPGLVADSASLASTPPIPKATASVKKKPDSSASQKAAASAPVNDEPELLEQKPQEQNETKPVPKPATPDLEKAVSVSSNDYEVGPFGGISKLALTVKNTSDHPLSLVVVQVEYLKVNKEVFKTEKLYFRDIAANSSVTLDAPRSSRGNKINYKVTLINSRDHLFHAGN